MVEFVLRDDEKRIFLALSPSKQYRDNILLLLKEIQKRNFRTIFISINQPSSYLAEIFVQNGIDVSRVYFIDAITRFAGGPSVVSADNCRFVNKPGDLTAMSMAVTDIMKKYGEERTVILLDSVNAMLIYSNSVDLLKFIHFVTSKLRIMSISGIFLAVERGLDSVLLSQFTSFADELIEFPDEKVS